MNTARSDVYGTALKMTREIAAILRDRGYPAETMLVVCAGIIIAWANTKKTSVADVISVVRAIAEELTGRKTT